jgi:hypothetical protein
MTGSRDIYTRETSTRELGLEWRAIFLSPDAARENPEWNNVVAPGAPEMLANLLFGRLTQKLIY